MAGQQYEYAFDDIGNRTSTKWGGDSSGQNLRSATYGANTLNQYTNRTVPGYVEDMGIANANASVTVNGSAAYRKGEYFWSEVSLNNTSAEIYSGITNSAIYSTTNTTNGLVFVPKTPEVFKYDPDGNLTNDGRWVYTWDGENRLVSMQSLSTSPTASKRKVDNAYDWKGRRIRKTSYDGSGGSYALNSDTKFLYQGWRCLAEVTASGSSLTKAYTWGLDLSGSPEGAGGIGGLLVVTDAGTSTSHFVSYDGNGNVGALAKVTDGSQTASYEYGPFGEVIRCSGTAAKVNPYRFSTKYQDDESDLLYYGYRFYNAATGRWLSRDPIQEKGGRNLYGFVGNDPNQRVDPDGRYWQIIPIIFLWGCSSGCSCGDVTITFPTGEGGFQWKWRKGPKGEDRFGSELQVEWTVSGDPTKCKYSQNETGLFYWYNLDRTGPDSRAYGDWGNHEILPTHGSSAGKTRKYDDWPGMAFSSPNMDGHWFSTTESKLSIEFICRGTDGKTRSKKIDVPDPESPGNYPLAK